jgi:transposase-like protein
MIDINNDEIIKLHSEGLSCSYIGKIFNCHSETIRLRLIDLGVDTSIKNSNKECIYCGGTTQKHGKTKTGLIKYICNKCSKTFNEKSLEKESERLEKYDRIKKMYLEDGLSTSEIGKILGVSSTVPRRILSKMGVTRSISESKIGKKRGTKLPVNDIISSYKDGSSSPKIAENFNCSKRSVLNILIENGVSRDNEYEYSHDDIKLIEELYLSGYSMNMLSEKLKIPYTTVNSNLHKLGVVRTENKHGLGVDYDEWLENLPIYTKYRKIVWHTTNKQPINKLKNHDKRGKSGIKDAYHLDHKFSISEGFKQGIEPEIIGNIVNLVFIPWEENVSKGAKCSITESELLSIYNKDMKIRVK